VGKTGIKHPSPPERILIMTEKQPHPDNFADLHRRAEEKARAVEAQTRETPPPKKAGSLLHELQVHQIELEMQNEELVRIQVELQEVSDKYQDLFDFAPVGYFLWDEQGKIVEVNLAGAALLRLDRSDLLQKRFGQFVVPESLRAFDDFCGRVLQADTKQTCEVTLLREGQLVPVMVEGIVASDSRGTEKRCRAAVIDISQRERAEAMRRESEQRLAGIVSSAMDAIISVDTAQRIVLFNAAAEQMFRCPAADAVGRSLDRFIPERFRALHAGHVRAFGEQGMTSRAMGRLGSLGALRADGEEFPMEASISQVEVGGQKLFTVIVRDITQRREIEKTLQRIAAELARSNKDLDQFASVASHDLQEPLRTVSGFVQLLQKKYANQSDAETDTFIKYAVDGTKRMETMITDLLAYARVTSRSGKLASTDANAALGQALDNLQASIQEKGAEIVHGELPTVRADASQLAQLFQNLIGNALKFHGEAPPKIHVDARREGHYWQFSVRDNGIGIDATFQNQIFEVFQRLHTRQQYDGTGIGLAICKKIVDRHGGRIWVESEPGQGATFHFTIPI
jgi:PAS domain S-box-containing protein